MPPKRKPLAEKNCDTAAGSSSSKAPKAKKPRKSGLIKELGVGPIRGPDADYTKLKLKKICAVKTKSAVLKLLKGMRDGLSDDYDRGCCVKEAIRRGYLDVAGTPEDLQKVVFKDLKLSDAGCGQCSCELQVTLEMLLEQPNSTGGDYGDGLPSATIICPEHGHGADPIDGRCVLEGLCHGTVGVDTGKFTNHCAQGRCHQRYFGSCIGDYREGHCFGCHGHYFSCNGLHQCGCGKEDDGYGQQWTYMLPEELSD